MLLLEQFHNLTLNPTNAARLKELVLQLAVQGKLTEAWRKENPDVEPASGLLKRIEAGKEQLVKEKKIKKEQLLTSVKETEVPFDLPDSWGWYRLGEIGYCQTGTTPSKTNSAFSGDYIPFIGPADISSKGINYLGEGLSKEGLERGRLISKNSVMMVCIGGSIGKVNVNTRDVSCNQQINTVTPLFSSALFVYYFLSSPFFQKAVLEKSTGSATPIINKGKWETIPFALPPLAEQEAIVARVEELFKNIEVLQEKTAKRIELKKQLGTAALQNLTAATLEDLPKNWQFLKENFKTIFSEVANVKKLRETILQLAVQGKLTQAWRHQNLNPEPASELLKRIQAEKEQLVKEKKTKPHKSLGLVLQNEMPYTLPDDWLWCRLSDIIEDTDAGKSPQCDNRAAKPNEFGFIKTTAIQSLKFLPEENKAVLKDEHVSLNYEIKTGDVLITRAGPRNRVGIVCAVTKTRDKLLLSDKTVRIKLHGNNINPRFLAITLSTGISGEYLESKKSGMADSQVNITQDSIKSTPIALPPFPEQKAIVAKVDELMKLCDELEKQIEQFKQETEALMQAVVQEAVQLKEEVAI